MDCHARVAREWWDQANAQTKSNAHHHGDQWTGPEIEMALREDLSIKELARLLGRSAYAIASIRYKATHDPKWISIAGLSN